TSEHYRDRVLGVSKIATVSTRTLFLSNGNNVGPIGDMARRCITINLNPACENPTERVFKRPGLLEEVRKERGRYVSAALTIVRAWIVSGCPMTQCRSLAGYRRWNELCRQPVLWLGLADPAASLFNAVTDDPDRDLLARLLVVWNV